MKIVCKNCGCVMEIEQILIDEIEYLEHGKYWVCAWWKPEYENKRRRELMIDIYSANKDIICLKLKNDR